MSRRKFHIAVTITDLGTGEVEHADAGALVAPYLNFLKDDDELNLYEEFDSVADLVDCENIEELKYDISDNIEKCEASIDAMKGSIHGILKDANLAKAIASGNVLSSTKLDDDSVIIELDYAE